MKDYEHQIIWLDYFNKNLSRKRGRKVNKDRAIFDPKLDELEQAAKSAGYVPKETNAEVNFPRRAYVRSGYIVVEKKHSKSKVINIIAQKLEQLRVKKSAKQS
ncbi:MAG: signal recognition particle subunit SRP19/SEC65 family protein [Nitrososphaerales archaeon]